MQKYLSDLRQKLLDLTLRNRFINFRPTKSNCFPLLTISPNELYGTLLKGRKLRLLPLPIPSKEQIIEWQLISPEILEKGYWEEKDLLKSKKKYVDNTLRLNLNSELPAKMETSGLTESDLITSAFPLEFSRNLESVYRTSISAIQERGTSVTYLTFGFLEWTDNTAQKRRTIKSPLLLFPINLERKRSKSNVAYDFTISAKDENLQRNETLYHFLQHDFHFELLEPASNESPEDYFQRLNHQIRESGHPWRVVSSNTISLLDFSKLAMYQDLDPDSWPNRSLLENSSVRLTIAGDNSIDGGKTIDDIYRTDELENVDRNIPLVLDADSSQMSAIIDALDGKNMVIEGPPGTGKSQTITNLIACLLFRGKTVLFASEKLAALNVVKSKLDLLGLGAFCMELHSNKSDKAEVRAALTKRLNYKATTSCEDIDHFIKKYQEKKNYLNKYFAVLSKPVDSTGYDVGTVLNKATYYLKYIKNPSEFRPTDASFTNNELLNPTRIELITNVEHQAAIVAKETGISNLTAHPWFGISHSCLGTRLEEQLIEALTDFEDAIAKYLSIAKSFEERYQIACSLDNKKNCYKILSASVETFPNNSFSNYYEDISQLDEMEISKLLDQYRNILSLYNQLLVTFDSAFIQQFDFTDTYKAIKAIGNIFTKDHSIDDNFVRSVATDLKNLIGHSQKLNARIFEVKDYIPVVNLFTDDNIDSLKHLQQLIEQAVIVAPAFQEIEAFNWSEAQGTIAELKRHLDKHKQMQSECVFDTKRHPSSEEIGKLLSVLNNGGVFKWFKPTWRQARKKILQYGKGASFDQLIQHGQQWLKYVELIENIQNNHRYQRILGSVFNGIETSTATLEAISKWNELIDQLLKDTSSFEYRKKIHELRFIQQKDLFAIAELKNFGLHYEISTFLSSFENLTKKKGVRPEALSQKKYTNSMIKLNLIIEEIIPRLENVFKSVQNPTSKYIDEWGVVCDNLKNIVQQHNEWMQNPITNSPFVAENFNIFSSIEKEQTRIQELETIVEYIKNIRQLPKDTFGNDFINLVLNNKRVAQTLFEDFLSLKAAGQLVNETQENFTTIGSILGVWVQACTFSEQSERNQFALSAKNYLSQWLDYLELLRKLNNAGLEEFLAKVQEYDPSLKNISNIYLAMAYDWVASRLLENEPLLDNFNSIEYNSIKEQFIEDDKKLQNIQKTRIIQELLKKQVPEGKAGAYVSEFTGLKLIRHEIKKKTRLISNRDLFNRAGETIQSLMPCFMMSPLSVAQTLAPGGISFDVIVMDEASQLTPEAALGVIARGKQTIVVGDPNQLPPTNFFNRMSATDEDDEKETATIQNEESILDQAMNHMISRNLKWHYRSQHQSLIAFSNQQFYQNRLLIFPSPVENDGHYGIKEHFVEKGVFDNRRNIEEAQAVARAAIQHVLKNPNESFGIVAMNEAQRDCIEDFVNEFARRDPIVWEAIQTNSENPSPWFVKNLENVQGDERDVIFISMTYGPQIPGGKVPQRFGPINQQHGWRRLNVLFTRSKKRMEIFTSMRASDITSSSRGTKALHDFLEYSHTGHLPVLNDGGGIRPPDSDFEIAVAERLNQKGYDCAYQIGVNGFYIDLAVRNPDDPNSFILGIECDGAAYHSSKNARDRDRLRQEILEGLGWKIHRVWSRDWFKRPDLQIEIITKKIEELLTAERTNTSATKQNIAIDLPHLCSVTESIDTDTFIERAVSSIEKERTTSLSSKTSLMDALLQKATEISNVFPDTDPEKRVLSQRMIFYFNQVQPLSQEEFLETCPETMRTHIDLKEAAYLSDIFRIIELYS